MTRKAITPLVAVVLLVSITISLVLVAYVFMGDIIQSHVEKSFIIQHGGTYCDMVVGNYQISILIANTGQYAGLGQEDFVLKEIRSSSGTYTLGQDPLDFTDFPVPPQAARTIKTICDNSVGGCPSGRNDVRLSTGTQTQSLVISCR